MNANEKIYTLLKSMQDNIDSHGMPADCVDFDFSPPQIAIDIDQKSFEGGEDFLNFKGLHNWHADDVFNIVKACVARGYINRTSLSADYSLLQLSDTGINFISEFETKQIALNANVYNIGTIQGPSQLGNNNTQSNTIYEAVQQFMTHIDNSNATPEEKQEAKSRLQKFLEHPIIAPVATAALMSILKIKGAM